MAGTIGGGCVEAEVWNRAGGHAKRKAKTLPSTWARMRPMTRPHLRRTARCLRRAGAAGAARLHFRGRPYLQSLRRWPRWRVRHRGVDDRDTFANANAFPEAAERARREYEAVFPNLPINETSYIIIVTRGHRDDMRVLKLAIATTARYIAMIGSKRKVLNVIRELEKEGFRAPLSSASRSHGPEYRGGFSRGDRHFGGAEMIAVRRGAASNWRSLSMSVFADESLRAVLAK